MNEPTLVPFPPLTRRLRIVSSRTVRERDERSPSCTEMRTAELRIRAREKKALDGGKLNSLGLYPTVAIASDGAVGLLGIVTRDGEELYAVLRYGLAPIHRP